MALNTKAHRQAPDRSDRTSVSATTKDADSIHSIRQTLGATHPDHASQSAESSAASKRGKRPTRLALAMEQVARDARAIIDSKIAPTQTVDEVAPKSTTVSHDARPSAATRTGLLDPAVPVAVSVNQAAARLGIGRTTAWRYVRSGILPARRLPDCDRVVVLVDDLNDFAHSLQPYLVPQAVKLKD